MRTMRRVDPEKYADQVAVVLAEVFGAVAADPVGPVVRRAVADHVRNPSPVFEVILDDPIVANWRLKAHPGVPGALRVADCRMFGTSARPDVDAVNDRLLALAAR